MYDYVRTRTWQALRNPGMRQRHWDQLGQLLGQTIDPTAAGFTLAKAEEQGLLVHMASISKVADVASKEYSIEQALDKMGRDWEAAELTVLPYRETGTFVVKVRGGRDKYCQNTPLARSRRL